MARRFVERDHPRWPRGSGDQSGEFRDKTPDVSDWADRLSSRIGGGDAAPAGRHGSVSTGITERCPICGRTVKVVGAGKLSTHNNPHTGARCTGSGVEALTKPPPDVQKAPGSRSPATVKPPTARKRKQTPGRPPPPPDVKIGAPLDTLPEGGQAAERMDLWQFNTGRRTDARRQAEIHATRENVERWERDLQVHRNQARHLEARRQLGLNNWQVIPIGTRMEDYDADVESHAQVQYYRRGLEGQQEKLQQLLVQTPDAEFDPTDPLAYYGDQLRIESDDWHTYEVLDALEQQIPPVFHKAVAEYLADRTRYTPEAGIYVGSTQSILDLDDLKRKIHNPPRGWGKNATMATWEQVDGVVQASAIYAVVHTENADSHRRSRTSALRRAGLEDAIRPTGDASLHEFGHLLDAALGYRENPYRAVSDASEQRRWRLIHGEVKRTARWLSPYYRQKGNAGPQEFWADAFYTWAAVPPAHRTDYMSEQYGLQLVTARRVVDYFDRLEKEITTGKRLPSIELLRQH